MKFSEFLKMAVLSADYTDPKDIKKQLSKRYGISATIEEIKEILAKKSKSD